MIAVSLLADAPQHLPAVAKWIFDEWDHNVPGTSLADVEAKMRGCLNRDAIPLTLVAVEDGKPVGTASLWAEDMTTRPELSPWLAAVFTPPESRRRGIAGLLVGAIEEKARGLGVRKMYLFTPDQERLYARLGWTTIETPDYAGKRVVVMERRLEGPPGRS